MEDKSIVIILCSLFAMIAIIVSVWMLTIKEDPELDLKMAKLGYIQQWTNIGYGNFKQVWVKDERK